ncbi:MAG TPA: aminotransferase class I/II-fold pyridoxal phosphate-dependent enzyme, partial [Candidatus Lustribacter sp.]|nr:aminotransferase class I/II-fold pyridoxal phosphate-dependent enzyme [Candidatus Lustribacter sp.]
MSPPDLDSLTPSDLRSRRTLKWTTYDADVLPLWVAEMDYPTAPPILEAITRAVRDETLGYPSSILERELGDAVAAWSMQRFGWAVDPFRVHSAGNVMHGLRLALTYYSAPSDPVILTTPAYPPFFDVVALARRPQVHVPMTRAAEGRPTLDLPAIDAAFGAGARTLVLCHPHNPLGRVFTRAEPSDLAEVVAGHGGRVVSDEIHGSLVYDDAAYVPYAAISPQTAAHTVTVSAASKAWNLPGLM